MKDEMKELIFKALCFAFIALSQGFLASAIAMMGITHHAIATEFPITKIDLTTPISVGLIVAGLLFVVMESVHAKNNWRILARTGNKRKAWRWTIPRLVLVAGGLVVFVVACWALIA